MKKLYYSAIILLVAFVGLVLPQAKAAGTVDYSACHIGFIDSYQTDSSGNIIGAYVYIIDSNQSDIMYDVGYFFAVGNFQPDIVNYGYDLIGKPLIWNPFDDRGAFQVGAWWLLVDYQQMLQDMINEYDKGYYYGSEQGFDSGYSLGYDNGYDDGEQSGFNDGYLIGYEDGVFQGWNDGYENGYDDGREQTLNSIENMEILYQDVVLPNGVKDEIIDNEILVDRVGVAVFDGSENWIRFLFVGEENYTTICFRLVYSFPIPSLSEYNHFISNRFISGWVNPDIPNRFELQKNYIFVRLLKSDLVEYGYDDSMTDNQKVNVFKSWLAAQKDAGEPLTVWYQKVEPVQYDLKSLLRNEDGSFKDGFRDGYNQGRVEVQRENKSLLSVIPTTIGAVWLMISDFLSYEVFGLNLWSIIIVFASFSLLVLIIKMVI